MLLHRVMEHVKAQNWTAVILDFVIVVLGVFIGIQLGNWNETRKDDVRAHQILADLKDEFIEIERAAVSLAGFYETEVRNLNLLLDGLRAGEFPPEDIEAVQNAIMYADMFGDPPPPSGAFRELLGSGNLALIRNKELRRKLIEYDQSLDIIVTSDLTMSNGFVPFEEAMHRHAATVPGLNLGEIDTVEYFVETSEPPVSVDINAILADPEFRVATDMALSNQLSRYKNIKLCKAKIDKIRMLIEQDLERPRP